MNNDISKAVEILKNGGIISYPTDTTFGIGCKITNIEAVKKIYDLKGRNYNKPLSIACSSLEMAYEYTYLLSIDEHLIRNLLPGAVTLVVRKKDSVSNIITAGFEKVGLRIPNYRPILELIELLGKPIITTSANLSGQSEPKSNNDIKIIVDYNLSGECLLNIPSTIIDIESKTILREGANIKYYKELLHKY